MICAAKFTRTVNNTDYSNLNYLKMREKITSQQNEQQRDVIVLKCICMYI